MVTARPAERYGGTRPGRRVVAAVGVGLLAVLATGWLLWAALHHANPDVAGRLTAFEVRDAHTVVATVQVQRRPGVAVSCVVIAQAADHAVVGEALAEVPAGPQPQVVLTAEITTERLATAADLESCRAGQRP